MNNMTRWQRALEHNPDGLNRTELWSVCVSVAMSFQCRNLTYQDFDAWYQWEWVSTQLLGRQNNTRPSKGADLNKVRVGEPEERVLYKQLDRAWETAERNIANTVLPSTADLRFAIESSTTRAKGTLLRVFDDMTAEMKRLSQPSFTYPCRPAAKRLGISHMTVCLTLKKMVSLGYIYQDRQGTADEGRVDNLASVYSFASFVSKPPIGQDPITCLPTTPKTASPTTPKAKKKRPFDPCSVPNLRKLDAAFGEPLVYRDVVANGGTVVHWKRWLRHLQRDWDKLRKDDKYCEEQETKDARVRLRIAEKDPDGHRAVEDHRIERDRKNRRWVRDRAKNSAGSIVVSPLRKMLEVVGFGIDPKAPDGTAVTFEYTEIFVCEEQWNGISYGRNHECLILTPQDDVSATMLAAVGYLDPTDLGRVEEVMEALSALKVIVKPTGG